MGKALQECAQVASRFGIASTDDICVVFDQFELYQVWLGGVGLCLSQKDFQLFCQLISEACKHPIVLSTNEGDQSSHPESPHPESPIRTTYHLFSIN